MLRNRSFKALLSLSVAADGTVQEALLSKGFIATSALFNAQQLVEQMFKIKQVITFTFLSVSLSDVSMLSISGSTFQKVVLNTLKSFC